MKNLYELYQHKFFLLWVAVVLNIITWLTIYFKIKPSSEIIPLHYNVFYGTDFAEKGYWIYSIPTVGILIIAVNYIFYRYANLKENFAAKIMLAVGLVAQIFIFISILFLKSTIV